MLNWDFFYEFPIFLLFGSLKEKKSLKEKEAKRKYIKEKNI